METWEKEETDRIRYHMEPLEINADHLFYPERLAELSEEAPTMQRIKFVLFSMLVSSSIFAAYSVSGFYFTVAYATATIFRPINLFSPFMA